jgi:hypothetical protein
MAVRQSSKPSILGPLEKYERLLGYKLSATALAREIGIDKELAKKLMTGQANSLRRALIDRIVDFFNNADVPTVAADLFPATVTPDDTQDLPAVLPPLIMPVKPPPRAVEHSAQAGHRPSRYKKSDQRAKYLRRKERRQASQTPADAVHSAQTA